MRADEVRPLLDRFSADASPQRDELKRAHEALISELPLADKLHCSYVPRSGLADVGRTHVTWAQGELFDRTVSSVSRRELSLGGLCLLGPGPADLVPAVTDQERLLELPDGAIG